MTTMAAAVEATLAALGTDPRDAAAAALARQLAAAIDALDDDMRPRLIGTIAPSLLKVLIELGATPTARGDVKPTAAPAAGGALALLRSAVKA